MAKRYVAAQDGVLLRVDAAIVNLYQGTPVPKGADENHVKLLAERGLLVTEDVPFSDTPEDVALGAADPDAQNMHTDSGGSARSASRSAAKEK